MNQNLLAAAILGAAVVAGAYLLRPSTPAAAAVAPIDRYQIVAAPASGYAAAYILDHKTGKLTMCANARCLDTDFPISN